MPQPKGKIMVLKREPLEKLLLDLESNIVKGVEVLKDSFLGNVISDKDTVFHLCEIISSSRIAHMSLSQVMVDENMVQEGLYRVDPVTLEATMAAVKLVDVLKSDMTDIGICMSIH